MIDDAARSCLDSLPHAFLCVTSLCNYKCFYCQPGGECHSRSHVSMDEATASLVVRALAEIGIGRLRITGGEPTLMPWLGDMLLGARDGGFDKIRLSTNGARLLDVLPQVQSSRARVQLSLDTLDPQLFREITRGGDLGAVLRVADALASKSIPTRVNTVLLRSSMGGFPQLLEFCRCRGFSMKVLGLECLDSFDKSSVASEQVSWDEFARTFLGGQTHVRSITAPAALGIGMHEYVINGVEVRVRFYDGWGATYLDWCSNCPLFPCSSGIYALQVFPDRLVSLCRFRRGNGRRLPEDAPFGDIVRDLRTVVGELASVGRLPQDSRAAYGRSAHIEVPEDLTGDGMQ